MKEWFCEEAGFEVYGRIMLSYGKQEKLTHRLQMEVSSRQWDPDHWKNWLYAFIFIFPEELPATVSKFMQLDVSEQESGC